MSSRRFANHLLVISIAMFLFSTQTQAQNSAKKILIVDGSSTIANAIKKGSVEFAKKRDVGVTVLNHGSRAGLDCLLAKTCQVGLISVELKPDEAEKLTAIPYCLEGAAVIVSRDLSIDSLTSDQIRGVFSQKITNWKEVGGPDLKITAFQRRKSGLQGIFDKVMKLEPTLDAYGSDEETMNRMKLAKGTITYATLGLVRADQGKSAHPIKVDGFAASSENYKADHYKMIYTSYLVHRKDQADDTVITSYIDHILKGRAELFAEAGLMMP